MLRKAFSLIELSIVLIIIGLLLAAVMKGKDLIRSAEMKKFYNRFVKEWELAYTQYYDRTGMPLGGPLVTNNTGTIPAFVGADALVNNTDFVLRRPATIENQINTVGLEVPTKDYIITFTNAPASTVWVTFGSDPVIKNDNLEVCLEDNCTSKNIKELNGKGDGKGNFMILVNVPYDVAAQIDRIIDGIANGKDGDVVCVSNYKDPINEGKIEDANIFNTTVFKDFDNKTSPCFGALHWGDKDHPYVTLMYKLGI